MTERTYYIALGGLCGLAALATVGYAILRTRRSGTLAPGEVPLTAVDLPSQSTDPVVARASPCRVILQYDFHLRPTEQAGTQNSANYRSGTEAIILQRGHLTRNGASMYRVRIVRTGAEGWIFVLPQELIGDCAGASPEAVQARLAARADATPTPGAAPRGVVTAGEPIILRS